MKKIMFVCSAGMSTSLLVEKTKAAAQAKGIDISIAAYAEAEAKKIINDFDGIFLGPQVRFLLNGFKKLTEGTNIPVDVIDTMAYGRMDGDAVLKQILKTVGE